MNLLNYQKSKPTEIDCIKVKKVYDECINIQSKEVLIEFELEDVAAELIAQCRFVRILEQSCDVIRAGLVEIKVTLEVGCMLDGTVETEEFCIEKKVRLDRAGEKGLKVKCEIIPECLSCFVYDKEEDEEETLILVKACVGIQILIKLVSDVQLLIPTYGFCQQPGDCEEVLGQCPEFEPPWPPYPQQTRKYRK